MTDKLSPQEILSIRKRQRDDYEKLKEEALLALSKIMKNIIECNEDIRNIQFLVDSLGKSNGR